MTTEQILIAIENISKEERDFLIKFGDESVMRKLLTSDEIQNTESFV